MALMGLMGNLASVCRRGLQTLTLFNPLSAKSDEHQFSSNNIHTQYKEKFMRINKMITRRENALIVEQILSTYS